MELQTVSNGHLPVSAKRSSPDEEIETQGQPAADMRTQSRSEEAPAPPPTSTDDPAPVFETRQSEVSINMSRIGSVKRPRKVGGRRLSSVDGEALDLAWQNVDVVLPASEKQNRPEPRRILKNISGKLHHGELMAVMGASGAGKTTFLNTLSGRTSSALTVSGSITLNGHQVTANDVKFVSAYVQQEDLFLPNLTVREHLTVQAYLRMDNRYALDERLEAVEDIISQLGLTKAANSRIGSRIGSRGLSGGEKKRLAFASELLRDPPILFVDEPTSGLDAFAAKSVIRALQDLVRKGNAVLCTIHQPSSDTFNMFNRVLLLAEGQTAYLGPLDGALMFFAENSYPCPNNYNPADHYVNVLAIEPAKEEESKKRVKVFTSAYAEKEAALELNKPPQQVGRLESLTEGIQHLNQYHKESVWRQFTTVTWRSWLNTIRDPLVMLLNLGQALFVGIMVGLIFLQVQNDPINERVQNIVGAVFVVLVSSSFVAALTVAQVFPSYYPLFVREDDNRMYKRWIYILSDTIANAPLQIIFPFIFITITYFLVGFQTDADKFFIAACILILVVFAGQSMGYCISVGSPNVPVAITLVTPVVIPFMLFAGLFLNADSTPPYFIWMEKISWFKWAFDAYMINEWKDLTNIATCPGPVNGTCSRQVCFENGLEVLNAYSLGTTSNDLAADFGILIGLAIGYRLLAYFILLFRLWIRARRR